MSTNASDTKLLVTSSPQIHQSLSTPKIMWSVSACLAPAGIWGVYVFGLSALMAVALSILASMATEFCMTLIMKKEHTLWDGSAFLTGLLIGFNLPPAVPFYIPVVASVFAIGVVKWSFGGLGANWMNPALAGRVFVFFSWTGHMNVWTAPKTLAGIDAVSGASPMGFMKSKLFNFSGEIRNSSAFLTAEGYPRSNFDHSVTDWLNSTFGINIEGGYADLFFGNIPGCIGEVSAFLLLLGAIYLFAKKIITWHIPIVYLFTFGVLVWIFEGLRLGNEFFTGDVLFHLFSGGLFLGVFFMATDMVTTPFTKKGMIIFAVGVGFLTFLIRVYGSFPEGVSLAIILMNMFVPLINRFTKPARFGVPQGGEEK